MSSSSSSSDGENPSKCLKKVKASLKQKNKLKKRVKDVRKEIKNLNYEITALKQRTEKLVEDSNTRLAALKMAASTKEETVRSLSEKVAATTGELSYTRSIIEKRANDFTLVQADITKTETELANTLAELKKVQNEEHDVEEHERQLAELAAKEAAEIAALQEREAKEQAEIAELTAKANEEKAKLHEASETLKKLDDELDSLNKQIRTQEIEIEHLGGHVEEIINKKLPPAHSDLQTHTTLVSKKEETLAKVTTDIGKVLEKLPLEVGEKRDLLKVYDTHTLTLAQLKQRVTDVEVEIHQIIATKQSIQQSYLQAVEAHKTELEHLEKANAELADVNSKLKAVRKENDVAYAEVLSLKEKIKALATEEAALEGAEAALAEKEAAERAELEALRKKEREERDEIANVKKLLLAAKHEVQDNEIYIVRSKQAAEKATTELTAVNAQIVAVEKEIASYTDDTNTINGKIADTEKQIGSTAKAVSALEVKEASLAHLEHELDEKIKELAHKEALEHQEYENVKALVLSLRVQLERVQADIAKNQAILEGRQGEHEQKKQASELDIKSVQVEHGHRQEVHSLREKEMAELELLVKKYSAVGSAERKQKKREKKKKQKESGKKKVKHHKKDKSSSSSSSSSSSD